MNPQFQTQHHQKSPDPEQTKSIKCGVENKAAFKDMLISSDPMIFASNLNQFHMGLAETPLDDGTFEQLMNTSTRGINTISLIEEDRQRVYETWKFSIIVKLFGKHILHHYIKKEDSRAISIFH